MKTQLFRVSLGVALLAACSLPLASAQERDAGFQIIPELQGLGGQGPSVGSEIEVSAEYRLTPDSKRGLLSVTAKLSKGWHIYSITQKAGGPMKSSIQLASNQQIEFLGPFQADSKPKVKRIKFFKVPVEEHYGTVTWSAPFRVLSAASELSIRGELKGQVCDDGGSCIPLTSLDTDFVARAAGTVDQWPESKPLPESKGAAPQTLATAQPTGGSLAETAEFSLPPKSGLRIGSVHAVISGYVTSPVMPGDVFDLVVQIQADKDWHVYAYQAEEEKGGIAKPTLIAVVEPTGWKAGRVTASSEPTVKSTGLPSEPEQRYHDGTVQWTVPVTVPASTKPGPQTLAGMVGFQACSAISCDMPVAVMFTAQLDVGNGSAARTPLKFAKGKYSDVSTFVDTGKLPNGKAPAAAPTALGSFKLSDIVVQEDSEQSVGYVLALAFLGGFVLNFMPCVLPVIGLKIMAFVQQAGENRTRIFMLNLFYSLGLLAIFWALATLASAASLGLAERDLKWGEQYNYNGFTIPLLAVVFVMGLSFLGVWEIPIPGFVGSGKSGELAAKEGLSGAFFKGVLTTILATPCSGPGLATALTWSAAKPPQLVYLVFTTMGLGMAFPYILIGAFPQLVRFIPKPGPWMDTFKQLMGFLLLGTVVYMFTLVNEDFVIPTLALIFALWFGCWLIGRTPISAGLGTKLRSWGMATAFAAVVAWLGFFYEPNAEHQLQWQTYSLATLDDNVKKNRTVLVDFTADW